MAYQRIENYRLIGTLRTVALVHHTRMIANQNGPVDSTRCSAANSFYREFQWQRRSKHTELES